MIHLVYGTLNNNKFEIHKYASTNDLLSIDDKSV